MSADTYVPNKGDTWVLEGVASTYEDWEPDNATLRAIGVTIDGGDISASLNQWLHEKGFHSLPSRTNVQVRLTLEITDVTRRPGRLQSRPTSRSG